MAWHFRLPEQERSRTQARYFGAQFTRLARIQQRTNAPSGADSSFIGVGVEPLRRHGFWER